MYNGNFEVNTRARGRHGGGDCPRPGQPDGTVSDPWGPPGPWLCTDLGSPGGQGVVVTHRPALEPPGPLLAVPAVLCSLSHCLRPHRSISKQMSSLSTSQDREGSRGSAGLSGIRALAFCCFLSLWLFFLVLLNTYVLTALLIVMKGDYRISEIQIICI